MVRTARGAGPSLVVAVLLLHCLCLPVRAQVRPWITIGSLAEDRLRLDQILGGASTDGYLLRTPTTMHARVHPSSGRGLWLAVILPELRSALNSQIPFSLNDGAMWAARGTSALVRGGVRAGYGPVELVLAPEIAYSRNRPFEVFPGREPGRSTFSSPWHIGAESADLPLRFGDQPVRTVGLGQSSLTVFAGPVAVGASSENQWWGPGVRNAIVMSSNAEGIPHFFLRTTRPLKTPLGALEARWIIGGLTESLYFDTLASNNLRSLSGLVVTLRPGGARNVTVGLARTVYGEAKGRGDILGRFLDVVTRFERLANPGEADSSRRKDQLLSLFGRWIFPESGLEVYGEWARVELPRSLRDLLLGPHHTQGYTLGLQWARPAGRGDAVFRFQAEMSNLEQSVVFADRPPPPDYYAGRATAHGYTQRGKVIGAASGPGSSSQWLAGDLVVPRWQVGVFAGRIRWENDALYRQFLTNYFRHDVSVFAGVRGAVRFAHWYVSAEGVAAQRLDYLFQNGAANPGGRRTIDLVNYTLSLRLSPR